jgi:AbrB family looped-hinge helix DNA binding protein
MGHEPGFVRIAENGRLSIPAKYRKLLGLDHGGLAVARLEDGELRLRPVRQVIADLQARVSELDPTQESGVDWLLQQRRLEFANELAEIEGAAPMSILDASAIIALLEGEPGHRTVAESSRKAPPLAPSILPRSQPG